MDLNPETSTENKSNIEIDPIKDMMKNILFNSGSDAIKFIDINFSIDENKTEIKKSDTSENEAYLNIELKFDARFVSI